MPHRKSLIINYAGFSKGPTSSIQILSNESFPYKSKSDFVPAKQNFFIRLGSKPYDNKKTCALLTKVTAVTGGFVSLVRKIVVRVTVLIVVLLFEGKFLYRTLGLFNKSTKIFNSVFLCYAASPKYAQYYSFQWTQNWLKWRPTPIAVFRQGDGWGLALGTTMSERDFGSKDNFTKLLDLIDELETISEIVNAPQISLAGILPSFLERNGLLVSGKCNFRTALAVHESYRELCCLEFNGDLVPVILLGGNGYVGKKIQRLFEINKLSSYAVDPANGHPSFPTSLRDKACIVIDVSRRGVLKTYINSLWENMVILTETFPEPPKVLISALNAKGITLYHLSGINGKIYPSLPHGYKNSIPCCAIHDDSAPITPILVRLGD